MVFFRFWSLCVSFWFFGKATKRNLKMRAVVRDYIKALTKSFSHHVFKGTGNWKALWGFKGCFHVPFSCFIVLPFINNGSYFLYYSTAEMLFITACNRCLETRDKHGHTSLRSARRGGFAGGLWSPNQAVLLIPVSQSKLVMNLFFPPLITYFSCKTFTKPSLSINLLMLTCKKKKKDMPWDANSLHARW